MPEDEQIEQLMQYFIILTENQLTSQYGPERSKEMMAIFKARFRDLMTKHNSMMPDSLSKRHGVNPVFVMALDDALGNNRSPLEDLKRDILAIYQAMMQGFNAQLVEELETSDDPWAYFIEFTKMGNMNNYENEYFNLGSAEYTNNKVAFDINRCLYFDIFVREGRPELGPILCEYDYIIADAVKKWSRFERTETIAEGCSRCDFRYYRV